PVVLTTRPPSTSTLFPYTTLFRSSFDISTDFIGVKAEDCLKLDRNSFNEKFSFYSYCVVAFRVLLIFINDLMKSIKTPEMRENVVKVWNSYLTQLHNIILAPDNAEISCGDEVKEVIHYTFSVDEKQQLFISKSSEMISQEKLLQAVKTFYQSMSKDKIEKKQVLILDIADIKDLKAVEER